MELNLTKPLLFFDIESTGLNIPTDGIIELSFVKVFPDTHKEIKTWKIKPWDYRQRRQIPINPAASAVNGVKDEDLSDCKTFMDYAQEIASWLRGSDLAGFNSTKFDLPMLTEEFERVKLEIEERLAAATTPEHTKINLIETLSAIDLDLHSFIMVDVQNIYHFMEPRNLRAAYRFYCGGEDFENAHTAEADTLATYEVLKGQLEMYKEPDRFHEQTLQNNVEWLSSLGTRPHPVDYAGRIVLRNGVPTINFGKHKDKTVREVFDSDRSYFAWIENGEFTLDTKRQFRILKEQFERELKEQRAAKSAQKPAKPLEGDDFLQGVEALRKKFNNK